MESSRRDLSNDMAEHRPILKTGQNMHYPRLSFTPKTGIELPKTSVPREFVLGLCNIDLSRSAGLHYYEG